MAKRKLPIKVGLVLPTIARPGSAPVRWSEVETMARIAEDIGFDSLWVVDHFLYQMQGEKEAQGCWECWSWLSALATCTRRVELGTAVLGLGFRNPALLAKMVDTVEEISNGRLILGVGAGYHEREYRAFGFPYDHRYGRFAEAIEIVHGLLRNGRIDFHGKYHEARECELRPRGPRKEGPPILFGSKGPKMLRLAARYGDSWNAWWDDTRNSIAAVPALNALVDTACREAGRDPATMERTVGVLVADPSADPWWDRMPTGYDDVKLTPLSGPPEQIAAGLLAYKRERIAHIQIALDPMRPDTVEALAPVLESLDRMGHGVH
jgi:alkanesulfonate monooxygenase SsuD/methylene tetrahydromethanopterin reductase-like flavin-dependent oxidoreductase (luciferase family)